MIQEIIEQIEREIELRKNMPHNYEQVDICYGLNRAKDIVSAMSEPGWIPVEERLPETEDGYIHVMVSMDDDFVCTTDYTDDDGFELWNDSGEVIAWMPLPEPYRPE